MSKHKKQKTRETSSQNTQQLFVPGITALRVTHLQCCLPREVSCRAVRRRGGPEHGKVDINHLRRDMREREVRHDMLAVFRFPPLQLCALRQQRKARPRHVIVRAHHRLRVARRAGRVDESTAVRRLLSRHALGELIRGPRSGALPLPLVLGAARHELGPRVNGHVLVRSPLRDVRVRVHDNGVEGLQVVRELLELGELLLVLNDGDAPL